MVSSPLPHAAFGTVLTAVLLAGCGDPGVGSPCLPESVPVGGFDARETYLETGSVQCQSRVCLVRELDGDPSRVIGEDPACDRDVSSCVTPAERDASVYCTCRCDGPDRSASYCECPDGFACTELGAFDAGGDGLRGSYCVRKSPPVLATEGGA